jgi:cold shock CspA family protein
MPEKGTVKFFDARDNKRFGFLTLEDGKEIFFHFNDGQYIVAGNASPEFSRKDPMFPDDDEIIISEPKQGDTIIFQRSQSRKGDKASPWGYYTEWEKSAEYITQQPIYRVVRQTTMLSQSRDEPDKPDDPEIIWEGWDREALSREYTGLK